MPLLPLTIWAVCVACVVFVFVFDLGDPNGRGGRLLRRVNRLSRWEKRLVGFIFGALAILAGAGLGAFTAWLWS